MDPLQTANLASLCSGILGMAKKSSHPSKTSAATAAEGADDVFLSQEAAEAQESAQAQGEQAMTPQQLFLANASEELSKLDPNSPSYFYDSVSTLVDSALKQVFGEKTTSRPEYLQMQNKIVNTIAGNEKYQEIVGDFLDSLAQYQAAGEENNACEAEDPE